MRFESKPESTFFVGITGGSCACKTTFARRLRDALGLDYCRILCQDSYYRDQSARFDRDGGAVNFDDPSSIDFALLYQHLLQLQRGEPINVPIYDFTTHKRLVEHVHLFPTEVILIEGTLILTQPMIVELLTESVFIDLPEEIRLERRIKRDIHERGRTRDSVLTQFHSHVKPMHDQYVEPAKQLATYHVFDEASMDAAIADLVDKLGIDS